VIFSSEEYDDEDLLINFEYFPAADGFVENRLHDELADRLDGLKLKKAYSDYPSVPLDGDIVCIDGAFDVYHTGDSWEPMNPDPNTLYFLVEP
ncbi:MAG: hypothetical protein J6V24_04310, partial [Clostridia bacterium]|nr:hypothetical protein [Clostridia bacterium]